MTACYKLTEQQQYQLDQTRDALSAIASLAEQVPADRTIQLSPDEVVALVEMIRRALPAVDDLAFRVK
jgi:hypothetical protein